MATGIYANLPEAELIEMRNDTLAELRRRRTGEQVVSLGGAGRSHGFSTMTTRELHNELNEINLGLSKVNPTSYGKRVTRTFAKFSHLTELNK